MKMYRSSSPESIQKMFDSIAQNYDRANSTFSFGLHKKWNRALIHAVGPAKRLLDLCAGTGEIAFGFLKQNPESEAILLDFSAEMLEVAQKKAAKIKQKFDVIQADAQEIPLDQESVDAVTISYGIRNVKEPDRCFSEVYRVLIPGGHFAILELTRPTSPLLRGLHRLYTRTLLPILGKCTAKNFQAYRYLAESIQQFASPDILKTHLKQAGFETIKQRPLFGGIATLIDCEKPRRDHSKTPSDGDIPQSST